MKKLNYLLLILIIPLLSGCYDYKEPDEIAYVVAIGIDEGETEKTYNFTIQFARPSQITGGSSEEGGSGKETTGIVNVDAPSLYTAINLANHVVSKKFTLSHTKIIILSDTVCKKSISGIIDSVGRSSDIRPSVYICVSNGEAYEYLEAVKPTIEINPVKYYQLIFENNYSSYLPVNDAQEIYFNFKNNLKQNVLPLVGVAKGTENKTENNSDEQSQEQSSSGGESEQSSQQGSSQQSSSQQSSQSTKEPSQQTKNIPVNSSGFEYQMKEYIAGNLDIKKQNASESIGGAVFKEDKMIGNLYGIEAEIYNILNGTFSEGYSIIYSEKSPDDYTTIRLEQKRKPHIDVDINNEEIIIKTNIYLEANFVSTPQDAFLEDDISKFEDDTSLYIKEALNKFLIKTQKEFDSDILGYGNYAKRVFLTEKKFNEFKWNEKYKTAKLDTNVEFNIRRTGLIIKFKEKGT